MTHLDTSGSVIEFLARSRTRVAILEHLAGNGHVTNGELRDKFDVARTTIQRNLDSLEGRGWIESLDRRTYHLSNTGEYVAQAVSELTETVEVVDHFQPFLEYFPTDRFDLDLRHFADAQLFVPNPSDPYAPVNRHIDAIETTDHFRCLLSAVGLPALNTAKQRIQQDGAVHEAVVDPSVAETLRSAPSYANTIRELTDTGRFSVSVVDADIPVYIGLTEECVQIGVEDESGVPQALVESETDEIRAWAEDTYRDYHARGHLLDIDSTVPHHHDT